jgi:arylsulfatase A-like enzyme
MHGSHGRVYKCVPYEESIRIPFIVYGPGIHGAQQSDALINHVDIAPTTLGLCGIKKTDTMRGFDYSSLILNGKNQEGLPSSAFMQLVDPGFGDVGFALDRERPWRGVVTNDGWKYAIFQETPWLMFNLNEDPYEMANLAHDRRFIKERQRLQSILSDWLDREGDSFKLPMIS